MSGHFDAVAVPPDGYVPGEYVPGEAGFVTYRVPDAVRAAALANAVELTAGIGSVGPVDSEDLSSYILDLARTFESYLAGEEANGQAD